MADGATSRAARLVSANEVAIGPWAGVPQGPGDVVVHVRASGICGTDVEIFRGRVAVPAGRVLGHEGAGIVGSAPTATHVELGQPVIVDPTIACGACAVCGEGMPNLCPHGGLLGRELDGVFADVVTVPTGNVHPLPDAVPITDAPLLQVLATVVHAQNAVRVPPGRPAAVVGLGCTGQLHAQLLAYRGAQVLGITRSEPKRELAARLACAWTAHPDDAEQLVHELSPLGGADLVVEAAGEPEALALAILLVRPGGTILVYGIQSHPGEVDLYTLYRKAVRLVYTRSSLPKDMTSAIELVASGAVALGPLISDRLPLDSAAVALERSAAGALKVVLEH